MGGGKKANVELFLELAEEKNYDRDYAGKLLQSWDLGLKLGCVFLKPLMTISKRQLVTLARHLC